MSRNIIKSLLSVSALALILSYFIFYHPSHSPRLPTIAIANYGPHASLHDTIQGLKEGLTTKGLRENQDFQLEISDVNFNLTLIPQMLTKLRSHHPKVFVTLGTPLTQSAKHYVKDIPIVFSCVTDPVAVGLLQDPNRAEGSLTGASDQQDLVAFLHFVKELLPKAKTIGLLYATGEANDSALLNMMISAASQVDMKVQAISVEQARDVPLRMQAFKDKVDLIYVGVSGAIQPSLPAIAKAAEQMHLPVFNADATAVKEHLVLGSFGVSYYQVGINTAEIVARVLQGENIATIAPSYPKLSDHSGYISAKKAKQLGLNLPPESETMTVVKGS